MHRKQFHLLQSAVREGREGGEWGGREGEREGGRKGGRRGGREKREGGGEGGGEGGRRGRKGGRKGGREKREEGREEGREGEEGGREVYRRERRRELQEQPCPPPPQVEGKQLSEVVEYYYSWKKYCSDEYRGRNRHISEEVRRPAAVCLAGRACLTWCWHLCQPQAVVWSEVLQ